MNKCFLHRLPALGLVLLVGGCGGGDPVPSADEIQHGTNLDDNLARQHARAGAVGDSQRIAAATATAMSSTNACAQIKPFYWEVGSRDGRLASGSVASSSSTARYSSTTPMAIASASKWIYGAYVAQRANGALSEADRKFLSMRAGYISLKDCEPGQTVDACLNDQGNGAYTPSVDNRFFYDGGHMQKHASLIGMGAMTTKALTAAIKEQIGTDLKLTYSRAQPGGGIVTSADTYARFLRKMMSGELQLGALLGSSKVCTNPATCKLGEAVFTPVPPEESWHYSIGHWVEDDPNVGDGAFSSAGSYGFYPWIDASRTSYGIIARVALAGSGAASAMCGRLIRNAWATGTAR